jgi:mannan endo-1,4-beta-mannosidase
MSLRPSRRRLRAALTTGIAVAALATAAAVGGPARAQVNANATARTKSVYKYLVGLKAQGANNRLLLGQNAGPNGNGYVADWDRLYWGLTSETGKEFAIVGSDLGEFDRWKAAGDLDWNAGNGCLITASWHVKNPWTGGGYRDRTGGDLNELLPGGAKRAAWVAQMDQAAEVLSWLQSKGRTVLWRPLHEMNGDWFWWCKRDPAAYKALWHDMYDYFTNTKKLNNLIWVYSPNNQFSWTATYDAYYPGADRVDVVGVDVYEDTVTINAYADLKAFNKPLMLAEFGPKGTNGSFGWWQVGEKIKNDYPEVIAALAWWDWKNGDGTWSYKSVRGNKHEWIQYHPVVVTKDELPAF